MVEYAIHYTVFVYDNLDASIDVWVNLSDLYLGHASITQPLLISDAMGGRDITAQLGTATRRRLFAALQQLQLDAVANPVQGRDGADYSLAVHIGEQCSLNCQWWCEVPQEWQELDKIVEILEKGAKAQSVG